LLDFLRGYESKPSLAPAAEPEGRIDTVLL